MATPALATTKSSPGENLKNLLRRVSSSFSRKKSVDLPPPRQYLLDHFNGHEAKAAKADQAIQNWRLENDIDDRIKFKPKHYDTIMQYLHSCILGRAKNGVDLVLAESYDRYDVKRFKELGIQPEDFQAVLIIFQEYLHKVLNNDPMMEKENGIYTVLDASTLDLKGQLNPKVKQYNDILLQTLDTYYPARSKKVFVVNHPRIFNMFWPAVRAAMPANIQKKIVPVKNVREIEEYISLDILPQNLGGNSPVKSDEADMHLEFLNFVNSLPSEKEFMATINAN